MGRDEAFEAVVSSDFERKHKQVKVKVKVLRTGEALNGWGGRVRAAGAGVVLRVHFRNPRVRGRVACAMTWHMR